MKIFMVQQVYLLLGKAELEGLTIDDKYKVIILAREFKKVAQDFEDFIKESQERITDAKELNSVIEKEATREIEVSAEKLGKEVFDKLLNANPKWNVSQILMLEEYIK